MGYLIAEGGIQGDMVLMALDTDGNIIYSTAYGSIAGDDFTIPSIGVNASGEVYVLVAVY